MMWGNRDIPFLAYLRNFYVKHRISHYLPYTLLIAALISGMFTYFGIKKQSMDNHGRPVNLTLLYVPLSLLFLLFIIIAKRLIALWMDRKKGLSGSKLHSQLLTLFAFASIVPGLLVAIFASLFFNLGVQAWFGEPVKNALKESSAVINAYVAEHERNLGLEAEQVAQVLKPKLDLLKNDRDAFDAELTELEDKLPFSECLVLTKNERILGKSQLTFALELGLITKQDFKRAKAHGWTTRADKDRLRALVLLDADDDIYLFMGRIVNNKILRHVQQNAEAVSLYNEMEQERSGFEINFVILFVVFTLLLLCAAMWVGLGIANRMIRPIGNLIDAAQTVSSGNLNVQVKAEHFNNELDVLVNSFNTMVSQLKRQQQEIILSQRQAAWSDIARKIAHEIKNPLTPIQLSAERLKKRYLKKLGDDSVFEKCIDTIVRQVGHIGNLVREFSNFARMPEAKMEIHDLVSLLKAAVMFESNGQDRISFQEKITIEFLDFYCDQQQITQVFINLIQNSIDALVENSIQNPIIRVQLGVENNQTILRIEDNGPGFSSLSKEKLMEPYYTTREKGTGLGLAIVEKIVIDHQGIIDLGRSPMGGAMVTIIFQKKGA
ncbi:MAG: hypothetical protein COY39_02380 [Alphaproteobacteria bacterium CG_4_10_14_0_8_um_filter_37_21]|nr:MAG: hypothetical protein COY39_02380 [Alphaproteobacteria bacterium CG_4_10_14_0_8_um_filter_37_21]